MGQGGYVEVVNFTPYRWERVGPVSSYQMCQWDFPDHIEPGERVKKYVEWGDGWLEYRSHDAAEARYRMVGTDHEFELQARNNGGNAITVVNMGVPAEQWGHAQNDVPLGWAHDGTVSFMLPGPQAWMSAMSDTATLAELNIPGTHDSATSKLYSEFDMLVDGTAWACCQSRSLTDQLRAGVRYLDIRCRQVGDSFTIHHGSYYAHMNFDEVLQECIRFLDAQPSETIVMSVKSNEYESEGSNPPFDKVFAEYVARYPRWYLDTAVPQLGQVRGRIVLVNRFDGAEGISWNSGPLNIQDEYDPGSPDDKWAHIAKHLDKAASESTSQWYLNFTSAYRIMWNTNPYRYALDINPRLADDLRERSGRYGTVIQDFCTDDVIHSVIRSNTRCRR